MVNVDISDILENSGYFDADWYRKTYPDVALGALDPRTHFLHYGRAMGRGLSPHCASLNDAPTLLRALDRRPDISYCIPNMNRPDDIRGTLARNLRRNAPLRDRIEFVLVFFDDNRKVQDWVRKTFAGALADGYLRMIVSDSLDGWHFGKAKNVFKTRARGRVYSSLDSDNFVTLGETRQLLEVLAANPAGFIFHHFTGNWGDGTSGRVSVTMPLFRRFGYDPRLLPRQFDEMDMILGTMAAAPMAPLIRYDTQSHAMSSVRTRSLLSEARLINPVSTLPAVHRIAPLSPKGEGYVGKNPELHAMQTFNQSTCFMKLARNDAARARHLQRAVEARHTLVDASDGGRLVDMLFDRKDRPTDIDVGPDEVCLFACMKNDDAFLEAFHAHYSALGAGHLFIVDDGSTVPIRERLRRPDVHVFRPKVGTFVTAKGLWLEALMKAHLRPGAWVLTVDADEFLDLPPDVASLPSLTKALARAGRNFAPGILVDMLPGDAADLRAPARTRTDFRKAFDSHAEIKCKVDPAYGAHPSIAWGFGPHAALSWRFDARYHAFGTFDSLRKIPLAQWRPGRHLNQGFHNLHHTDGTPAPGHEIWETEPVLPIRHYKLAKLFSDAGRAGMERGLRGDSGGNGAVYHARTTENVTRILGTDPAEAIDRLTSLPRKRWSDGILRKVMPERTAPNVLQMLPEKRPAAAR